MMRKNTVLEVMGLGDTDRYMSFVRLSADNAVGDVVREICKHLGKDVYYKLHYADDTNFDLLFTRTYSAERPISLVSVDLGHQVDRKRTVTRIDDCGCTYEHQEVVEGLESIRFLSVALTIHAVLLTLEQSFNARERAIQERTDYRI